MTNRASIILRSVHMHIVAAFLGCWVPVRHLPTAAKLADRLTRKATTTKKDLAAIAEAIPFSIPAALTRWLAYPSEDWSVLCEREIALYTLVHFEQ
jgi:hypothetical protein